jgi:predicted ATP-dependent endonuclease of OLD family
MLLKKIRIENFRSLKNIEFDMSNYIVVFGKNNEGKSNILKAIKRFWDILPSLVQNEKRYTKSDGIKLREYYFRENYKNKKMNIEKDIPIEILELKNTKKNTNLTLTFELDEIELQRLNELLTSTSRATNYLEVTICYNRDLDCKVFVKLKETGRSLSVLKNIFITLSFLLDNFSVDYIPSIRTEEHSVDIIENIISQKHKVLEESEEFIEALNKINELQTNLLADLSKTIEPDLKKYISSIKSVEIISLRQNLIRFIRSNNDIIIDDGKKTSLIDKGDGIKSLVALSLLQSNDGKNRILMIDEPESHLHSGAIKELESKIKNESKQQQILISTHHQIFVNRNNYSNNLVLSSGSLKKNTDIRMIRKELGVGLGENLFNAELVVLVEGETDKVFLQKYIELKDQILATLIRENRLVIDVLRGTKNLESKLLFYKSGLCRNICILDNDGASNTVLKTVEKENLLDKRHIYIVPLYEKDSAELEDLYDEQFIFTSVDKFFGLTNSISRKGMKHKDKFTDKLNGILGTFGKKFQKKEEEDFKWYLINQATEYTNLDFISKEGQLFFDPIIERIKSEINQ